MTKAIIYYIRRFSRMRLAYIPFTQQILIGLRRC